MSHDQKQPQDAIHDALLALCPTGPDGFEGLIRDAFQEATGVALRLLKSGQQGGVDGVSDFSPELFSIGIEAKKYSNRTTLSFDDLKKKLIDATTRTGTPIEVWILVASKEISADDVSALVELGVREGISVFVLDWNRSSRNNLFSPLSLLLTHAPGAVRRHLGNDIFKKVDEIHRCSGLII